MVKKSLSILFVALCMSMVVYAAPMYPFKSAKKQQQFAYLTQQLRCLVCQNESISSSTAPLAAQLRQVVYQMVQQGKTNHEIKQYMVKRYGDFVLFKPPFTTRTYLLWLAPAGLLILGLLLLTVVVMRRRSATQRTEGQLSNEQNQRIQELLDT